ncbi:MAG: hypothetical protein ACR2NZ_03290 [Rubripirellula sp.]
MSEPANNRGRRTGGKFAWLFTVVSIIFGGASGICIAVVALKVIWNVDVLRPQGRDANAIDNTSALATQSTARNNLHRQNFSGSQNGAMEPNQSHDRLSQRDLERFTPSRPPLHEPSLNQSSGFERSIDLKGMTLGVGSPPSNDPTTRSVEPATASTGVDEAPSAAGITKTPPPSEEQQTKSLATIKSLFEAEYRQASSASQKLALAEELMSVGIATDNDPIGRFVLLKIARDIASQVGDIRLTEVAIEEIDQLYDADIPRMRLEAYQQLASSVHDQISQRQLVSKMSELIDELVIDNRLEQAMTLLDHAFFVVESMNDKAQLAGLRGRKSALKDTIQAYENILPDIETLASNATDPAANLALGMYTCFTIDDWYAGLPMLELGSDAEMKRLAALDHDLSDAIAEGAERVRSPSNETDEVMQQLGDGWWSVAESVKDSQPPHAIAHLRLRSAMWYAQIRERTSGLRKRLLEKRMSEATTLADSTFSPPAVRTEPIIPLVPATEKQTESAAISRTSSSRMPPRDRSACEAYRARMEARREAAQVARGGVARRMQARAAAGRQMPSVNWNANGIGYNDATNFIDVPGVSTTTVPVSR